MRSPYLAIAALCSLLAQGTLVAAGKADQVPLNSAQANELVYESIEGLGNFASNLTAGWLGGAGWYNPKLCSNGYCVFANKAIANGRGMAMVTSSTHMQKLKRLEPVLNLPGINGPADPSKPPPYEEKEIPGRGIVLVANQTLKRGDQVMSWSPVLIVHKSFYDDVPVEEQTGLLAAAVALLPDATRAKFTRQVRAANAIKSRDIRDIVRKHSFESNLGYRFAPGESETEKHYVTFPEVTSVAHDCRPNMAYHIDYSHVHRTTAARKVLPGEELTISYISPFGSRAERQQWLKEWHGEGCSCMQCHGGATGDLGAIAKSDANLEEIQNIEKVLKDHTSRGVTTEMIARLIELYKEERLESRFSDMYETVALNYNNLGYAKRAKKYALLSAQAGAVERGPDANDILAMRIMADDPEGHYSYRARMPKKSKAESKA